MGAVAVLKALNISSKAAKTVTKVEPSGVKGVMKSLGITDTAPSSEGVLKSLGVNDVGQPNMPSKGFHGTVGESMSSTKFDTELLNKKDQFLGEGFYISVNPTKAEEYSNIRAIKGGRVLDAKKDPRAKGKGETVFETEDGDIVTTSSIMKGTDVEGKAITKGQNVLPLDISGLQKTYFLKDNKERLWALKNRQKLVDEGYDSIAFKDFADRSEQIVVFPEYVDRVKGLK